MVAESTRQPALRVERLTRAFGGLRAVDGVDLAVREGELVGIVGPNGAGKTTLFSLLSGELRPSSGDVFLGDRCVTGEPMYSRARLGIGRTFQIVRPFRSLTVAENVVVCALARIRRRRPAEARAAEILERVRLADRAHVSSAELTLAERKRLEIARALATEPHILLLDEVMAGLNPVETKQAIELVAALHADGLTVLLIEHNLKAVRSLCERLVVLNHGSLVADGAPSEVLKDERVVEAYIGRKRR